MTRSLLIRNSAILFLVAGSCGLAACSRDAPDSTATESAASQNSGTLTAGAIPPYITSAVTDPARPAGDTERDSIRLPAESVAFSMLKPGDKIAELLPGRGYFTRILSKVVGPGGHVYATNSDREPMFRPPGAGMPPGAPPPGGPPAGPLAGPPGGGPPGGAPPGGGPPGGGPPGGPFRGVDAFADDATYGGNISVSIQDLAALKFPEPLDMVWTSLNYHDLPNAMFAGVDRNAMNKAIYDALKPGGIYFVIDHAAAEGAGASVTETLHRIEPAFVRAEVEAAGFVLDGESDILRNPLDNHTGRMSGTTLADQTDKFVFRFRKPAQ